MKTLYGIIPLACCAGALVLSCGCSIKTGSVVPQSAFIFPNSNLTPLGPTKVSKSKTAFFISPNWKVEDTKEAYNKALEQVPGANILTDYSEDTTYTTILFFNTITYTLEGNAGKMEVGKQILK